MQDNGTWLRPTLRRPSIGSPVQGRKRGNFCNRRLFVAVEAREAFLVFGGLQVICSEVAQDGFYAASRAVVEVAFGAHKQWQAREESTSLSTTCDRGLGTLVIPFENFWTSRPPPSCLRRGIKDSNSALQNHEHVLVKTNASRS